MVTYNGERIVDAAFAEQVYEAVARIPCGKVATYGQIARWSVIRWLGVR